MRRYRVIATDQFDRDCSRGPGDKVFAERLRRRVKKLGDNPAHHGNHAGGLIRCKWKAGIGRWIIVYDLNESQKTVTLLRFLPLED